MDKHAQFLMLVQTACLTYEIARARDGSRDSFAVRVLAEAMRLQPESIPQNLEQATWDYVDSFYGINPTPDWVRYGN